MSGVDLENAPTAQGGQFGAQWVRDQGGTVPADLGTLVDGISAGGGTPLVVGQKLDGRAGSARRHPPPKTSSNRAYVCVRRFDGCAKMGIRTVMITGDNP